MNSKLNTVDNSGTSNKILHTYQTYINQNRKILKRSDDQKNLNKSLRLKSCKYQFECQALSVKTSAILGLCRIRLKNDCQIF